MTNNKISAFPSKPRSKSIGLALIFTVPELLSGCSPYVYSTQIQAFGNKVSALESSYKDTAQKIVTEKHQADRADWILLRTKIERSPSCVDKADTTGSKPIPCEIWTAEHRAAWDADQAKQPVPVAATQPDETPEVKQLKDNARRLTPPDKQKLFTAIDNYSAALIALTKAEDRAAFDNAAGKLSAAVGSLAASAAALAGGPAGAAASPGIGTLASSSTNAIFWLVGQGLDYQRLKTLRISTQAANTAIHTLAANAIGDPILSDQRHERLHGLEMLLTQK